MAAVFGTYDIPVILLRLQRGIRRALALQQYLLARAARGRNLRFVWGRPAAVHPHHRPPSRPAPRSAPRSGSKTRPDPALLPLDDLAAFYLPTQEELLADVRRRPVGRTMTYICLDLGVVPGLCDGAFWNQVEKVLRRYGGSLNRLYDVRARREKTFQRERDARPDTWHIEWRGVPRPTMRRVLGCLIGETPPDTAATYLPVIAPS